MRIQELEALKGRIETAKADKARAEGALDRIESQWDTTFKVKTVDEAEALLATMDEDLERDESRLEGLLKDLDGKVATL